MPQCLVLLQRGAQLQLLHVGHARPVSPAALLPRLFTALAVQRAYRLVQHTMYGRLYILEGIENLLPASSVKLDLASIS